MASQDSNLTVVGVGASVGGMESLRAFFHTMPADSGLAFVVIQHLNPDRLSSMSGVLAKLTDMSVVQAEDGTAVSANSVYTIPPNKFLSLKHGKLQLTEPIKRDGLRMPIDFFFRSLAEDRHERAIAVILSGAGSDGTLGMREVHGKGGVVLVQDPRTAQFDSMPNSAVATGMVDSVLPVGQIPAVLLDYLRQSGGGTVDSIAEESEAEEINSILGLLGSQIRHNFQAYRRVTVRRRIQRRMGLKQIDKISDYLRLLQDDSEEAARLAKDLLIGVTSFFRDPEELDELRAKVIAPMVAHKRDNAPLRVWTVGCSTGEETYSIAILIREALIRNKRSFPVQIFASDISADGLKYARDAIYPESIAADVSQERLARFFVKRHDGFYQLSRNIRDSVTFAAHSVLVDPPFMKMQLISCRNLLIDIESEMQKRIDAHFAFALNPGGYLFLGKSDSLELKALFEPVSSRFGIYRRSESGVTWSTEFPTRSGPPTGPHAEVAPRQAAVNLSNLNRDVLLKHFDAAVVLIDEQGSSMYFFGPVNKYMALPPGAVTLNLFDLIEKRHSSRIRFAVAKAFRENETVTLNGLDLTPHRATCYVNVTVSCVVEPTSNTRLVAVIIQEAKDRVAASSRAAAQTKPVEKDSYISRLEADNKSLSNELQSTPENFHTSFEELSAANQELLTMNEELQSTNEELESAKEDLQSVNDQLLSLNNQLNENMEELGYANDDLANFLNSSEVGTIFLDSRFCIRRFTPATTKLLSLLPADVGRPIEQIANRFVDLSFSAVGAAVLKDLRAIEKDVHRADGSWYTMRCLPYRTLNNRIDGVVFTFTDVTRLKRSEELMQQARRFAESIVDTLREPLLVLDANLRVVSANRACYRIFQVTPEYVQGRTFEEIFGCHAEIPELRNLLESLALTNQEFNDFELDHEFPALGRRTMMLSGRPMPQSRDPSKLILLSIEDYTERKRAGELLSKSEEQQRQKAKELEQQLIASGRLVSLGEITASMAHEFNNPLGIVMGFAEDLLTDIDPSHPHYRALSIINDETRRCEKIILEMMEFARPRATTDRLIDIAEIIDTTLRMIDNRIYKQKVVLAKDIQPDLPKIHADPSQLEQLLINLHLNALDSMLAGGTLTVASAMTQAGNSEPTMVITVADTGVGIDEYNLNRIFLPFFTTGKRTGLGLGLSVCDRIVKNHGGRIDVESRLGQGSSFRVYLPLEHQPAQNRV
jgi:two-component system CheB/CheR fusion protein